MDDPEAVAAYRAEADAARDALVEWLADRIIPASRDRTGWRLLARWRSAMADYHDAVARWSRASKRPVRGRRP